MADPDDFAVRVDSSSASSGPTRHRGTPSTPPTMRLLRAVDAHKPYAGDTRDAQRIAWQRVEHNVWGQRDGKFEVEMRFYALVDAYRLGTSVMVNVERHKLLDKLSVDLARCESLGRGRSLGRDVRGETVPPATDPTTRRRRRREPDEDKQDDEGDAEQARPPRKIRQRNKKSTPTPKPTSVKRDVDAVSDEHFVELLLEHTPHLATAERGAWARIAAALPPENALHGRSVQALVARYQSLKRAIASGAEFSPRLKMLLDEYALRVAPPPSCTAKETEPVHMQAPPLWSPPQSSALSREEGEEGDRSTRGRDGLGVAALALAARIEDNIHRERESMMIAELRRLDVLATLINYVMPQHTRGETPSSV